MGKQWTEEEQILALNLYFKLPFGKLHQRTKEVQRLAGLLDRTPSSVAMKLSNYAALDQTLDRKGLSNTSNKDERIWNRYWQKLDELGTVSEYLGQKLREEKDRSPDEDSRDLLAKMSERFGTEVRTDQKRRIGQQFFRRVVMNIYDHQCCVCNLKHDRLLEAAHILNWSEHDDPNLRVNPRNGLAFWSIHHKGFDEDVFTVDPEDKVVVLSSDIKNEDTKGAKFLFHQFENESIFMPEKFEPDDQILRKVS